MAEITELRLSYRLFVKTYRWRRIDPVPWAPLKKPLEECRVGLVSTAGFVLPDQVPFDESIRGGDYSFREIPSDTDMRQLTEYHRSDAFDHAGVVADPNLGFPIDRIRELADAGEIGSVNGRHFSFMGSITAPGRLIKETAPQAAERFVEDDVDLALLVPV